MDLAVLQPMRSRVTRVIKRGPRTKQLDGALAAGLPAVLEEPLRFLIDRKLSASDEQRLSKVEELRSGLQARAHDSGNTARGNHTTISQFATVQSVDPSFGTFLYLVAKASGARTVLELGSCVGISGAYIASSACERFVSIEGGEIAAVARETVQSVNAGAEVIHGYFDDVLAELVPTLTAGLDMAWIDGDHTRAPTLRYFETVKPVLSAGAIVIFDDIAWSPEMKATWQELQQAEGFSHTVTLSRVGLGVWQGEGARPKQFDLAGLG